MALLPDISVFAVVNICLQMRSAGIANSETILEIFVTIVCNFYSLRIDCFEDVRSLHVDKIDDMNHSTMFCEGIKVIF